jgi:F-type H+-transporting ATPase subunit c
LYVENYYTESNFLKLYIMEMPRIIGAGLVVIGTGIGIGKIGAAALEGMARQPEQAGKLQTAMLIAAALVEGVAFAALFAVN